MKERPMLTLDDQVERHFDGLFHPGRYHNYERVDTIKVYRNVIIYSITYYYDGILERGPHHRMYEFTINGKLHQVEMNKRGGNLARVKEIIDEERSKK